MYTQGERALNVDTRDTLKNVVFTHLKYPTIEITEKKLNELYFKFIIFFSQQK